MFESCFRAMVLNGGDFSPPGDIYKCLETFGGHDWNGWKVEARNAAEHLTTHRIPAGRKEYTAHGVHGAKVEKPCSGVMSLAVVGTG